MYSRLVVSGEKQKRYGSGLVGCVLLFGLFFSLQVSAQSVIDLNSANSPIRLGDFAELLIENGTDYRISDVTSPEIASKFTPITHDQLNFGFTSHDYWIRFMLKAHQTDDWLLEVGYPLLDILEFYVPRPDGSYLIKRTGDTLPFATREITYNNFVFALPKGRDQPQVYYLHIETEGAAQAPLVLWPEKDFNQHVLHERIGFGVYYGIIFVMGLYNLFLFLFVRDKNYLYYVIYIVTYGLMQLSLNGLAFEYLWPESAWWSSYAPVVFVSIGSIGVFLFTRSFLNTKIIAPLVDKIIVYLILSCSVTIIITLYFSFIIGARLATLLALLLGIVILMTSVRVWQSGYRPARYFLFAWVGFLLGIVINALLYFGLLPNNIFTGYAMQAGSVIEAVLFSLAIADRLLLLQQEKNEAEKQARQRLSDLNVELEQRVEARTSELFSEKEKVESANSELEIMNAKLAQLASLDTLTDLYNHRTFIERLTTELSESYRYKYTVAVIMLDLDHFKKINDRYGHPIGDEVLIRVAAVLRDALRQSDMGARYGGEEFVLMLPHSNLQSALQTAERIRNGISAITIPGKPDIKLSASLGVACTSLEKTEVDYKQLIRMADEALYHAKHAGRDQVSEYRLAFTH